MMKCSDTSNLAAICALNWSLISVMLPSNVTSSPNTSGAAVYCIEYRSCCKPVFNFICDKPFPTVAIWLNKSQDKFTVHFHCGSH